MQRFNETCSVRPGDRRHGEVVVFFLLLQERDGIAIPIRGRSSQGRAAVDVFAVQVNKAESETDVRVAEEKAAASVLLLPGP